MRHKVYEILEQRCSFKDDYDMRKAFYASLEYDLNEGAKVLGIIVGDGNVRAILSIQEELDS